MIHKAALLALAWALMGVQGEWLAEIPDAPPRWKSKLFDIPTWIVPIEGNHVTIKPCLRQT